MKNKIFSENNRNFPCKKVSERNSQPEYRCKTPVEDLSGKKERKEKLVPTIGFEPTPP